MTVETTTAVIPDERSDDPEPVSSHLLVRARLTGFGFAFASRNNERV